MPLEKVEPIKPVTEMVARPEAAPNYVAMYSEAIKGALAPYEYLLNYRKELSEEDVHKAEIQRYLDEHDEKSQELAESHRRNLADEAQKSLENALSGRKLDEDVRHNMADESHNQRSEAIASRREQTEADRVTEEERHNKQAEKEAQDKLDLQKKTDEAQVSNYNADAAERKARAKELEQQNKDRENDATVIDNLNDKLKKFGPQDYYTMDDNPELRSIIQEANKNINTPFGKAKLDEIIGQKTALGIELNERDELAGMGAAGRKAFHDAYVNSDKNDIPQNRFNTALESARVADKRDKAKAGWTSSAKEAYDKARLAGKPEDQAFADAQLEQLEEVSGTKQKPTVNKDVLEAITASIPMNEAEKKMKPAEGDASRVTRANRVAAYIGLLTSQGKHDEATKAYLDTMNGIDIFAQPGSGTKKDHVQRFFNTFGIGPDKPTTLATPLISPVNQYAVQSPQTGPTTESSGFLLPGMTRNFQDQIDSGATTMLASSTGGGGGGGGGEEEEARELA